MFDSLFGTGKLEKMIIVAFKKATKKKEKPALSDSEEDKYMVQVNPDSYTINYRLNYNRTKATGKSGSQAKFADTAPPGLDFTFLFDATGVIPPPAGPLDNVPLVGAIAGLLSGGDEPYDVITELGKFSNVVYTYDGKRHEPRKIQLTWGKMVFIGVLKSLSVSYKLFAPDGTPLRAEAKASFEESLPEDVVEKKANKTSPDLTHIRRVIEGDKLPLMAHKIYGDTTPYIEVARSNKIYNFRKLNSGRNIYFPPTSKPTT